MTGHATDDRRPPTIREVAEAFRESKETVGLARRTLQKYEHCIRVLYQLAEEQGIKRITQITPAFMDKFREHRIAELAKRPGRDGQKTATNDLVTIRGIVNFALRRRLIREDPLAGYSIKKAKTKPQPYWVQTELDRILKASRRQPHKDVFLLLAWTGMRIGEVEYLTWEDIDFDNRVIKIQEKDFWKPKTGDARSVQKSSEVVQLLSRQPKGLRWVFTFPTDGPRPQRQIRQRRILQYLKRVLKKLGLKGHVHTFRHTFVSLALTRGVALPVVREWVGHLDPETIRRYTHIGSEVSQAAMLKFEQSIMQRRAADQT